MSCTLPRWISPKSESSVTASRSPPAASRARRRCSASRLATFSERRTSKRSPAGGTSFRPITSTGVDGPAELMRLPSWSAMARMRPEASPQITASPWWRVPVWTSSVATTPALSIGGRLDHDADRRPLGVCPGLAQV